MNDHGPGDQGLFPPTAWSRIVAVAANGKEAREALEDVCRRYWHPARKFLRSLGCSEHDAEDLTQRFFARWARPENFEHLDPSRGRLRSYLKQSLRREFITHWQKSQAARRDAITISLDDPDAPDPSDPATASADWTYDAAWAEAVVAAAVQRLRNEYLSRNRAPLFDAILPALPTGGDLKPYAEIAVSTGMTEPQIKLEIHRVRRRFAERLREEVAGTLADSSDLEDELRHLLTVMARTGVASHGA